MPPSDRAAPNLPRLLASPRAVQDQASPGIRLNEHMEGDGPTVFATAVDFTGQSLSPRKCGAAFDVLHIILQNSAQVSDVLPRWPMIGSTRLRLLALHSSSVSHACTPKLERRTRCRYSPRSRRATGPCCQSKPGHVGQDIRKRM